MADYPNRSDLRNPAKKIAVSAARGQTYGEAGKQIASQQAVPMGPSPTSAPQMVGPSPTPGNVVDLAAPTERPETPLNNNFMADVPQATASFGDPVMEELRQLYFAHPNEDLAALLAAYDRYFR